MSNHVQISFIGGGSVQWGPRLAADLMLTGALAGGRLVLYDIDGAALEQMARLARRMASETGSGWVVEAHDDPDRALRGASFVIFSIAQGGLEAHRLDLEIPWRYGIAQPVGDTIGPGGISRALRHIPVALGIARRMEDLCPQAWFINLTNPLTAITRAVNRETRVRALGLCHELTNARLAELLGANPREITFQAAGVNHLPWILRLRVGSQDGFALLREWLAAHGPLHFVQEMPERSTFESVFEDRLGVKLTLFQVYGCLPGAGDRHVVEFFPGFLAADSGYGRAYGVELTTFEHRRDLLAQRQEAVAAWIAQPEPLALNFSGEQAAGVVAALGAGQPGRFIVNVPNAGQIDELPREVVVESQADLSSVGVEPLAVGRLPPPVTQVLASRVWQHETIVDAAVGGDRDRVLQALVADPMIRSWPAALALRDELLAAHAAHLPQFRKA